MIDRATIDQIFSAADIVDVVGDFVQLKKKGTNFTACCPFHNEKTPSFIVSPAKGLYKCFGCGKGGNAVSFVMEHEKLTYPEALRWMAKKYNIEIQEKELSDEQKAVNNDRESMMILSSWASDYFVGQLDTENGKNIGKAYFYERGFTDQTIQKFGLGYCSDKGDAMTAAAMKEGYKAEFLLKTGLSAERSDGSMYDKFLGRVIFPIHSLSGRTIGFGGRTMRTDKNVAKYLNSPESEIYHKSATLYGIFFAKKAMVSRNRCILVEGYTDVIQMHQAGIEHVVASSGTSLTVDQIKLIRRFTQNVTVIYDGDSAGIKASLRGIDMILSEGLSVRVVPLPAEDDPDSFARKHNATQIEEYIEQHQEDFISFKVRTLMGDATSDDPIKRADIISDIIQSIAVIPDAIQRSVYIRECSRTMDIDASILETEIRRKIATGTDGAQGRTVVDNRIRKERFEARQNTASVAPDNLFAPNETPLVPSRQTVIDSELANLESELVGYLLKYGGQNFDFVNSPTDIMTLGVASTIIDELRSDEIEPKTEPFATIYSDYCRLYDAGEMPTINHFINHSNQAVSLFVVDMLTREDSYKTSTIWARHEIKVHTEAEILSDAIPKVITIYKSKVIAFRIALKQMELGGYTEFTADAEQLMTDIGRLNDMKTALLEKYQRLL